MDSTDPRTSLATGSSAGVESRRAADGTLRIPLLEETLEVGKVRVDLGGVRIRKRVETVEQTVELPLVNERVEVERRTIGRQVDAAPQPFQEGDTWVVPVVQEVLVTEKRLMLVEEIRIRRVRTVDLHTEAVSLRKEVADIERLGPEPRSEPVST